MKGLFLILSNLYILNLVICPFATNINTNKIFYRNKIGKSHLRFLDVSGSDSDYFLSDIDNSGNRTSPRHHQSKSGLSAGAICAIVIPCVAALIGVGAAAAILGGSSSTAAIPLDTNLTITRPPIDASNNNLNDVKDISIQPQIEMPNPPVQQIIKPTYPINNIENPVINNLQPSIVAEEPQIINTKQVVSKINQIKGGLDIEGGEFKTTPNEYGTSGL